MKYLDMYGKEIKAGDTIRCVIGGDEEKVYVCQSADGKEDLGISASNETYLKNRFGKDWELYRECYLLYQLNTQKEWAVIRRDTDA